MTAVPNDADRALVERLRSLLAKATPGPWRWELNRKSKSVEICGGPARGGFGRFDLTVVSFVRWGMNRAAPQFWQWSDKGGWLGKPGRVDEYACPVAGREHHADWFADIDHPVAQIMVEAVNALPALLARIEALTTPPVESEVEALREAGQAMLAEFDADEFGSEGQMRVCEQMRAALTTSTGDAK